MNRDVLDKYSDDDWDYWYYSWDTYGYWDDDGYGIFASKFLSRYIVDFSQKVANKIPCFLHASHLCTLFATDYPDYYYWYWYDYYYWYDWYDYDHYDYPHYMDIFNDDWYDWDDWNYWYSYYYYFSYDFDYDGDVDFYGW